MIKKIGKNEIVECVKVIRESFMTVADEFGFTVENASRFTAFATTEERLYWHLDGEHRPMYAFYDEFRFIVTDELSDVPVFYKFNFNSKHILLPIEDLKNQVTII